MTITRTRVHMHAYIMIMAGGLFHRQFTKNQCETRELPAKIKVSESSTRHCSVTQTQSIMYRSAIYHVKPLLYTTILALNSRFDTGNSQAPITKSLLFVDALQLIMEVLRAIASINKFRCLFRPFYGEKVGTSFFGRSYLE